MYYCFANVYRLKITGDENEVMGVIKTALCLDLDSLDFQNTTSFLSKIVAE